MPLSFPDAVRERRKIEDSCTPQLFEYLEPGTLDDVLALLQKYGDEARILAGGQSLVPLMKLRLVRPEYLIDLNRVPDLRYIRELDGCLCFGTLARHVDIQESVLVEAELPMMRQAAGRIGDTQVRKYGHHRRRHRGSRPRGRLGAGDPGPQRADQVCGAGRRKGALRR